MSPKTVVRWGAGERKKALRGDKQGLGASALLRGLTRAAKAPPLLALQTPPRTLWLRWSLDADIMFEEAVGVTKPPASNISELAGKSGLPGAEGSGSCHLGVERAHQCDKSMPSLLRGASGSRARTETVPKSHRKPGAGPGRQGRLKLRWMCQNVIPAGLLVLPAIAETSLCQNGP